MRILSFVLILALLSVQIYATETIPQIARAKAEKEKMVAYFKNRIKAHQSEKVTLEQMKNEIRKSYEGNVQWAKKGGYDSVYLQRALAKVKNELAAIDDKDMMLAWEQSNLHKLNSTDNYLFICTKTMMEDMRHNNDPGMVVTEAICLFITVPLDIALLPFTLIASAVTGF